MALVTLGILVTIHEFGHYWVARRCGVHVLRFAVGFGRPLLAHTGRNGTEFTLCQLYACSKWKLIKYEAFA